VEEGWEESKVWIRSGGGGYCVGIAMVKGQSICLAMSSNLVACKGVGMEENISHKKTYSFISSDIQTFITQVFPTHAVLNFSQNHPSGYL